MRDFSSRRLSRWYGAVVGLSLVTVGLSLSNLGVAEAKTPTTKKKSSKPAFTSGIATLPPAPALKLGESVPVALVNGLFFDGFSTGEIVVGKLPGGFPANFPVIPGSTVLGGMSSVYGAELGNPNKSLIGVLQTSASPESVAAFLQRELTKAGWTQPVGPNQGGGFDGSNAFNYLPWCSDSAFMNLQPRKLENSTLIRVMVNTVQPGFGGPCGSPITTAPTLKPLPKLTAPAGVVLKANGSGGYGDFATSNASARTTVSVSDLLNHFDAQLVAAGWKQTKLAAGPVGARASYDVSLDGKIVPASLLIISPEDGTVTLTLTRGAVNNGFPGTVVPYPVPAMTVPVPAIAPPTTQPPPLLTTVPATS
jgi:hypothetical protein